MKEIKLIFKTKKGEEAYFKIEEEGKNQSGTDRRIVRRVAKDKTVSTTPLVVIVQIKIKRLAIALSLDEQIELALKKCGAKKNIDYTLEVIY